MRDRQFQNDKGDDRKRYRIEWDDKKGISHLPREGRWFLN